MSLTPASAKAKGSKLERDAAKLLGGKRAPLSGAVGGGDLWIEQDSLFAGFVFECKARKVFPAFVTAAMKQCETACFGAKRPAVIFREDRGREMVMLYLEDFVNFSRALSEVGEGHRIKGLVRDVKRSLEAIEAAL